MAEQALARFLGLWAIDRHIYDLDSEWPGRFRGQARFAWQGEALAYEEQGWLRFGGLEEMRATRRYLWQPEGDLILVRFADGRPFHRFDPTLPRAPASHYCDPDAYEVTYEFRRWPEWRAEWRVEGPRKDYRLVSIYTPA